MNTRPDSFVAQIRLGALALAAAVAVSALSACGPRHHTPEGMAEWAVQKISRNLALDDAQKAKLEAVKQAYLDARNSQKDDRAKRMDEFREMILSDRLDAAKMKDLIARRRKDADESFDPIFSKIAEFHASLTPEQRKKAAGEVAHFERFDQQ